MDFFEAQAHAKKRTVRLAALFGLAVIGTFAANYFAAVLALDLVRIEDTKAENNRRADWLRFELEYHARTEPAPDGRHIAFSRTDGTLYLRTVADNKTVRIAIAEPQAIPDFVWSPDGKYLAFTQTDLDDLGYIYVWDVKDARLHRVTGERVHIFGFMWSARGGILAFTLFEANREHSHFLWSVSDGQLHRVTEDIFYQSPLRFRWAERRTLFTGYRKHTFGIDATWWHPIIFYAVMLSTLGVAGVATVKKWRSTLSGMAVAEMMGGRRVDSLTTDLQERRLLNVVEEMAIASGMPVPVIYVLDDEPSLNAFAAGYRASDAVIAVTRGTLEKMSRDELQGIIAHEFSHIFNGDMKLNTRLISVLFGILVLGLTGRGLLRVATNDYKQGSWMHIRAVLLFLPCMGLGLVLTIVGYAGYFLGRLIQSGVSRQREYLADASAVQFTRNLDGIVGALKKIGGDALGSFIVGKHEGEICHLFFAQSSRSRLDRLWATHPPLAKRIRALDPTFDGNLPVLHHCENAPLRSAVKQHVPIIQRQKNTLTSRPGNLDAPVISSGTISNAQALLQKIPPRLREAAYRASEAPVLIYGLLLAADIAVRDRQLSLLPSPAVAAAVRELEPALRQVLPGHKLPLCQLALPALRELRSEAVAPFLATIKALVQAEDNVSVFESVLQAMLARQLARPQAILPPEIRSCNALKWEIAIVLSALAHRGATDPAAVKRAYLKGVAQMRVGSVPRGLLTPQQCAPIALDRALGRLARAASFIKQRLLLACTEIARADGEIRPAEVALIRTIAAALDCPMPLLVDEERIDCADSLSPALSSTERLS